MMPSGVGIGGLYVSIKYGGCVRNKVTLRIWNVLDRQIPLFKQLLMLSQQLWGSAELAEQR